jgi:hypothetical protein
MVSAHAFENQMQRMIRVEVRNLEGFNEVFEGLFFSSSTILPVAHPKEALRDFASSISLDLHLCCR